MSKSNYYRKNSKGEFEKIPPVTCKMAVYIDEVLQCCNGIITEGNIYKPFDENTPIGGSYRSPKIDSFATCGKCKTRFDQGVLTITENGSPIELYVRISPSEEDRLRRQVQAAFDTSDNVSDGNQQSTMTVDEYMKKHLFKLVRQ